MSEHGNNSGQPQAQPPATSFSVAPTTDGRVAVKLVFTHPAGAFQNVVNLVVSTSEAQAIATHIMAVAQAAESKKLIVMPHRG